MPLARIFTRNPERTADLSNQLKQQGYSVEVASPEQANLAPADLEIEFEVCERADVLDRAADLANEIGADIAVASGVLRPEPEPAAPPVWQVATIQAPEPVKHSIPEPELSAEKTEKAAVLQSEAAGRDPERDFEAAFAPVMETPAAIEAGPTMIEIPVMEAEPMPPVAFLDEPPSPEPIIAAQMPEKLPASPIVSQSVPQSTRSADPMPYLAQLTPFGSPFRSAEEPARISAPASQQSRAQEQPKVQVRSSKALEDGARIAAQTWASALALAASTKTSVRDHFEEYRKRAQVRSAEVRAQHAARLLDLEQRRAEAHQRAAELEAAREQAAARLMELVRQREPGLPPERLRESMAFEPVVPVQQTSSYAYDHTHAREEAGSYDVRPEPPAARETFSEPAARVTPIDLWRRINPPLRAVLTGAAAVTALFIMGIALGLFHSRPPLASTAVHASDGVSVQTGNNAGGVTLKTGADKARPVAAQSSQSQTGAAAPAQARNSVPAKPSPRVAHLVAQGTEKQIGDDVVIRHFSRPVPTQKPKQAGQQAGLKHFSDLEN